MKNNILRTLARSNEMQTLYARSKDIGLQLFDNTKDYSRIQIIFLSYLELYHGLYKDISMGEDFIDYELLNDDMDVDAYLVFRSKKEEEKNKPKEKVNTTGFPNVLLRKKRK